MKRIAFYVLICYGIIAILDVFFSFSELHTYRIFTKTLLMPLLMVALWAETGLKTIAVKIFAGGLLFSWIGDIVLGWEGYFIYGLTAFLIAHIFYLLFILKIKGNKGLLQFQPLFAIPMLVYLIILLFVLNDYVAELQIPVFIYGIVICTVCILSMNLFWKTDKRIAALLFAGTSQFVMSDSLLAINKFVYPFEILPGLVMLTYCSAQFLLTLGAIKYDNISKNISL